MKLKISFLILSLLASSFPRTCFAEEKINKFGIHILEPSDLPKAQELVNSSGGDWGWVTVVIRDDEMNHDKWQLFMDECRERHLIPLVRIATHLEGTNWTKPKVEDSAKWADFLNNLNWPVSNQYIIVFNEPNHAKEWGGEVNPKEYGLILLDFIKKFQISNFKFLILNAGLDLAAPNGSSTMNAYDFMQQMNEEVPGIFDKLDGWASHSYPNHGFLGKPWNTGKTSVRGYEWELNVLKNTFKVQKNLPVFITETGWPIQNTKYKIQNTNLKIESVGKNYYSESVVAEYIKYAYENVWLKDSRVMAITPFVLNYPGELFADFSWLDKEGRAYPQFETVQNIEKQSWWPEQETRFEIKSIILPPFLPTETEYHGKITLKNTGQSIWGENSQTVSLSTTSGNIYISNLEFPQAQQVKPYETLQLTFTIKSSPESGEYEFCWSNSPKYKIKVLPASILSNVKYTFWEKIILKIKSFFQPRGLTSPACRQAG